MDLGEWVEGFQDFRVGLRWGTTVGHLMTSPRWAIVKCFGNQCDLNKAAVASPGIINVCHDLRNLQIGQGGNAGHRLDEFYAVYGEWPGYTVADKAGYRIEIVIHIVGRIQWRINAGEAAAVCLMTVAAMGGV